MRSTQEKFQAVMQATADKFDLDLVVDHTYANTGRMSFQLEHEFDPVLEFTFRHYGSYSSFEGEALGLNPKGGRWSCCVAGPHDDRITLDEFVGHVADLLTEKLGEPVKEERPFDKLLALFDELGGPEAAWQRFCQIVAEYTESDPKDVSAICELVDQKADLTPAVVALLEEDKEEAVA